MRYLFPVIILLMLSVSSAFSQWSVLNIGTKIHMRGVHAVSPSICWASGTGGTVLKTVNGGKTWTTYKVAGGDSLDFRDIHAFDKEVAIAMSAGESEKDKARIYRTDDGGESWKLVYQTSQGGVFLDGIDFWDRSKGICVGDPVGQHLFLLTTNDGGRSWQEASLDKRPASDPGEACFAASGTSILAVGKGNAYIGTGGGKVARVFRSDDYGKTWSASATPLAAGPTSGIFGLRFWSAKNGMAVGGDYKRTTDSTQNILTTADGGITWKLVSISKPAGLKESVGIYHKTNATWNGDTQIRRDNYALIASGPSGSGYTLDHGKTWSILGKEGFHAMSFAGNVGYGVGANGLIGKIEKVPTRKQRKKLRFVEE